jgi:DNA polymerase III subunit delta
MPKSKKEKLSVEFFLEKIRKREFSPVYFFYGEEDFLFDEIVDAIVSTAVDESTKGFNLDILDGSEANGKEIVSIALSFPMMAERRVVLVKDFDHVLNKEAVESYVEHPLSTTILVLLAGEPDTRKKPYPAIKKNSTGGQFNRLYDNEIPGWIQRKVKQMKRQISIEAEELLHSYVGNSLRDLSNQLEKLAIAIGDRTSIEANDVRSVVGISKEFTVFELTKAVGQKNLSKAMEIMEHMMDAGESPQFIIIMLTRHFTVMWKLNDLHSATGSEYELAQSVQVSPYFIKEYLAHLQKYNPIEIENALLALTQADEQLKTTSADPRLVLDVLLFEMTGKAIPQFTTVDPTESEP